MTEPRYRWSDAPHALTAAIWTLASTGDGWDCAHTVPEEAIEQLPLPLIVAARTEKEPLATTTLRLAARATRPIVAVSAELRGRMPCFEFAVGLPGEVCNCFSAYEAWIPICGGGLWLVSAFLPHPNVPVFALGSSGLARYSGPPWTSEQDRDLGIRHATVALARLIGDAA